MSAIYLTAGQVSGQVSGQIGQKPVPGLGHGTEGAFRPPSRVPRQGRPEKTCPKIPSSVSFTMDRAEANLILRLRQLDARPGCDHRVSIEVRRERVRAAILRAGLAHLPILEGITFARAFELIYRQSLLATTEVKP